MHSILHMFTSLSLYPVGSDDKDLDLPELLIEQEIAKTSEHIASKSIYLWKVNYRAVLYRVLDDLYHAATNLCLRHAHEIQKEQEVGLFMITINTYTHPPLSQAAPSRITLVG